MNRLQLKLPRRVPALLLCGLLIIGVQGFTSSPARADNPARKILTGWLPYYGMKTALPDVMTNSDLMQTVNPFWYTLKDQNTITDLYTPANPSIPMAQPLSTLRTLNLHVVPTITDGTSKGVLAGLLAKDSARANVVRAILNLVMSNQYDGIDLDFENFAFVDGSTTWSATQSSWVTFISDLSTALHAQGKTLSVTTPVLFDPTTGKKGYYIYAWSQIGSMIDELRIMAYDYSIANPGPIGPITWTEDALKYAVSVIPASKIYLGVPGYGRDWIINVTGTCPVDLAATITPNASAATFVMRNAATLASTYSQTPTYVAKYGESTFTYTKVYTGLTKGGQATSCSAQRTVWYQDPQGFLLRANFVTKYHIAGIAEWTLGMEDPAAITVLRGYGQTIAPDPVSATIATNVSSATYGAPISITAQFKRGDKTPISALAARIEEKSAGGDWRTIYSGTTGVDGSIAIKTLLAKNASLRAISTGSWNLLEGDSPEIAITISRLISWSAPSSMRAGAPYAITGFILPRSAGVTVALDATHSAMTDSNGNFAIPITEHNSGLTILKLSIAADPQFAATATDSLPVLVR